MSLYFFSAESVQLFLLCYRKTKYKIDKKKKFIIYKKKEFAKQKELWKSKRNGTLSEVCIVFE